MNKFRLSKKAYIHLSVFLSLFLCTFFFFSYTKLSSNKINNIAENYFKNDVYSTVNGCINEMLPTNDITDILNIYKNEKDEILYVDYDLNKSYDFLNAFTNNFKSNIKDIEVNVPFFVFSNNIFLYNVGPDIKLKIKYASDFSTKLFTKVTNYGINNALLELYIKINTSAKVVSMVNAKTIDIEYDLLISSKVVNGKVPSFYNENLTSSTAFFDSAL